VAITDQPPPVQDHPPAWPRAFCVRHCGLFCAGALAAIALFFIGQASMLALGTVARPGPGFFPLVLGVALLFCSIWIGAQLWRDNPSGENYDLGHRDVIIAMLALLLIAPAFERLGAYLTLGLFAFVLLILVARTNPFVALASSILGVVAIWYFFQILLGVQLPKGILMG
jgi:hypothetical protein